MENPKTFLPLLLFMGFLIIFFGLGFSAVLSNFSTPASILPNSGALISGGALIVIVAVLLFVLMNRGRIGF